MATVVPPLVVVVGPTASGKTALAITLAHKYGGEIICADSRTVYRGMDIGTAKPTLDEQTLVPHWGLDLAEPDERFTAAAFKDYAVQKIDEIRKRGHVPFLVGGSGLYIDAVLFDYEFGSNANHAVRTTLEAMSVEELQEYCSSHNIELPENSKNPRHLVRVIEQGGINHKRNAEIPANTLVVGIATNSDELRTRIYARSEQLFANGVVNEARILGKKYGWESEAMTGNIYRILHDYLENVISLEEAKERFAIKDCQLAKRQLTWFRRNPHITWLNLERAGSHLNHALLEYEQKCATV
jgi:tRNA dimethylallyltransferase